MQYKLSPSTLSLFKDCPRCFWLQLNKGIKRPAGIFPSLPSGMDRILKIHFDSFMKKGLLPPELKELTGSVKLFDDQKLLEVWQNNFEGVRWKDDNGNTLFGAIDNLLVKGDKLIVLDFKTRGFPCKEDTHGYYQDQMDIYNFLLRKNGYMTEDYTYLLFYHPEKVNEKGHVEFNTNLKKIPANPENAEKIFKKALETLNELEPKAGEKCEYCRFQAIEK